VLAEFFTWWRQQLLELVPETLRRGSGADGNALVAEQAGPGLLSFTRRRRGVEARLAQVRLDEPGLPSLRATLSGRPGGEPVVLRLPPEAVLERGVTLPLAAERDMERVLGYEMERLTPFTADEVYWGASLESRDRARGRLAVHLALVPRAHVQELVELLTSCGGAPSLIETETAQGPRAIRLAHEAEATRIARLSPRTAAAVLAGLAALVVLSPFLRQSLELAEAQGRLDAMQPKMQLVNELRRRIAGAGAGGDVVAAETRRLGDALAGLAAVTEILPDDSYLTEFTMRERKITLSGLSASAPKLISALSADDRIHNPAFTAPVTKQETGGHNDVFAIRAELAE
jgi:general secretion pathway protein L